MGMLGKGFGTDPEKEKKGVWVTIYDSEGGSYTLLLARTGGHNVKYSNAFSKAVQPYLRQISAGNFPESKMRDLTAKVFAHTVVLGWKEDVQDEDGNPIPFSPAMAVLLLGGTTTGAASGPSGQ